MTTPIEQLRVLGGVAHDCTKCPLSEGRTNVVFGIGSPEADLMIVGEAPGEREDLKGEPFIGRSGQLLDRMLGQINLARDEVYICNVVKCRPPENRDPKPDEITACRGYLDEQVRLVDPKVVLTVGNFAAKTLLGTKTGITKLRGRSYPFQGRTLVPTFHPAAVLRASRSPGSPTAQGFDEDFRRVADLIAEIRAGGVPAAGREAEQTTLL